MKVIKINNFPSRPPIWQVAITWLLLDRFPHPGWVTGVAWSFVGLIVIAWVHGVCTEEPIDIFKDKP